MSDFDQNYDDIPIEEVKKTIQMLSLLPQDKKLGVHMCKLQNEFGYPPVFPNNMIPLPKEILKKWGFNYASIVVKEQRILKQFQQDAALYYTRFRQLNLSQWDAIKTDSVENFVLYNAEIRDKKSSDLPITIEFKNIIDSYRAEYDAEANELQSFLKSKKPIGCALILLCFLIFNTVLLWALI